MRSFLPPRGFFFLLVLSATLFVSSINAEVVDLTDATFEHQTQASTGATTGSWLVLFTAQMCQSCNGIRSDLEELSQDSDLYERGIVLGSVDAIQSPQTADRFDITNAPTIIYIHKKQVYRLDDNGSTDEIFSQEYLKKFVLEDYSQVEGSPVPGIPSAMEKFLSGLTAAQKSLTEEGGSVTIAILGLAVLTLLVVVLMLIYTMATTTKTKKD